MISTASSSLASSLNATSTSSKRLSGLVSGLDTDTLVKQLTAGTQSKIDKQGQLKQIALWRQQSYREVTTALQEFQSKYFSSTTSSSSILNAAFFNSTSIKNTSSFLNVSGSASAAKNMVVTGIAQLAQQAGFASKHKVSDQTISGAVNESWRTSTVAGSTITVNYGGKDYQLALDSDFTLTSGDSATDQLSKATEALNAKIAKTDGLAGNIEFAVVGGKVTLTKTGSSSADIKITDGSDGLLKGLGLSKDTSGSTVIEGGDTNTDSFFKSTLTAGSTLDIEIDGNAYTLTIPSDTSISSEDSLGTLSVKAILEEAIRSNPDLKDKLSVDITGNTVSFSSSAGALKITGGSQNLLQGLGLTKIEDKNFALTGTYSYENLVSSYLGDSLSGSTLTVSLDGVDKYITFKESEKEDYSTPEKLAEYLQTKLTAAYGKNSDGNSKFQVSYDDATKTLNFKAASSTSIIAIESSDVSGILGKTGALGIYAGETNRLNTNKDLEDVQENLATPLVASTGSTTDDTEDDTYGITINDKTFTFKSTDTINTIIKTINNDAQANVTITYSSVSDTFSVTAKNGGSGSRVDIEEVGTGNLAAVLFGTVPQKDENGNYIENADEYSLQKPQDAVMTVSFDGNPDNAIEITRTENKFTLDGVDFELLAKTDTTVSKDTPITFSVNNQTDDLYDKIKSFVDDYNAIIKLCNDKVSERKDTDETYDPLTDAQKADMSEDEIKNWEAKAKKGILNGDSILSNLSVDLRSSMTDQVASMKAALYEIGIATKANDYSANGQLTIDEETLKNALNNNPDKVASLFTSEDGIAARMQDVINKNIKTTGGDGILITKAGVDNSTKVDNSTLTQAVTDYNTKIKELKTLLETQQEQYYAKFTRLEQYLSNMNSQASLFLTDTSS
ncbi:flagellar filament capping protein FliD [Caproiciproducens sp. CPB-2]|uniref:flagellar filament capping protein FliD n=1 Tax=Caproiciproducens sp. CPB-2 TaxID=3030017 RepID=UPI0023DBFD5A|nr:flagellar filament capping protein FliD [Caproiciproducens sp. CPB-2]MDF1494266.1 flagellar filament capping protein FliD [Caproiciproducens sp. CPB-2]